MANEENLIHAKKGQVLNPNGRPKGSRNRSTIVRELLEKAALKSIAAKQAKELGEDVDLECKTIADQIAAAIMLKAMAGDTTAFNALMDSAYGKIVDKVETEHKVTQMGRIQAETIDASGSVVKSEPLTFNVGLPIDAPETDADEE